MLSIKDKNFVLLHGLFDALEFGKDSFLVPYYFRKIYGANVSIVYVDKKQKMPEAHRAVPLRPIKNVFAFFSRHKPYNYDQLPAYLFYVLKNAKKIDVLMRFHLRPISMLIGVLYKTLNPRGFLYFKADGGQGFTVNKWRKTWRGRLKKLVYRRFVKLVDLITVETETVYKEFQQAEMFGIRLATKTRLLPNGFDEVALSAVLKEKDFPAKENLIITVGRLGTEQKNTQMLLTAVEKLNLQDWRIVLIGHLTPEFKAWVEAFFARNPALKDKLIFTGAIYAKKDLWEWYNKARIFVLTSRFETWGLVLNEAVRFRNYLLTTDVGGARQLVDLTGYGTLIPQEDTNYLFAKLRNVIAADYLQNKYNKVRWENVDISWEKLLKDATKDFIKT
ncbi:glycosyl transferase GTB-type super family [Candidatus Termititenax aidoneus]|uniref:Glycosyl transferase GTB-type super family n=1 Tax=Termititenax aidoneus TaxID=2218524 RepID=A0A388TBS2_TERA1|nr:glycosyl transferase GTB-type super family [Candidatus Termititenax aidoneus]